MFPTSPAWLLCVHAQIQIHPAHSYADGWRSCLASGLAIIILNCYVEHTSWWDTLPQLKPEMNFTPHRHTLQPFAFVYIYMQVFVCTRVFALEVTIVCVWKHAERVRAGFIVCLMCRFQDCRALMFYMWRQGHMIACVCVLMHNCGDAALSGRAAIGCGCK